MWMADDVVSMTMGIIGSDLRCFAGGFCVCVCVWPICICSCLQQRLDSTRTIDGITPIFVWFFSDPYLGSWSTPLCICWFFCDLVYRVCVSFTLAQQIRVLGWVFFVRVFLCVWDRARHGFLTRQKLCPKLGCGTTEKKLQSRVDDIIIYYGMYSTFIHSTCM